MDSHGHSDERFATRKTNDADRLIQVAHRRQRREMLKSKALKHISRCAEELCPDSTRSGRFGPAYPPLPTVAPPTRHAALPQVTQTDQASSAAARAPAPTLIPCAREGVEWLETCRAEPVSYTHLT